MVKTFITSVVAHIDHGKTTLIDSLIANQGTISKNSAGNIRFMDTRNDEQERGITLKLSASTLKNKKNTHIIIDTPGHVDFESLVQTSAYMADNFLVIVDINEGVTPRLLAIVNHIKRKKAILVLNKIDKKIKESNVNEFLNVIKGIVCRVNGLIGEEYFDWYSNNVILAWSTMCAGINYAYFLKISNGKNAAKSSLKLAIRFIFCLIEKINKNETKQIVEKFKISSKNEKGILMGVLPLANVIFDSIEYKKKEILPVNDKDFDMNNNNNTKLENLFNNSIESIKKENLSKNDVDFDISKITNTELENLPKNGVDFEMNNSNNTKSENLPRNGVDFVMNNTTNTKLENLCNDSVESIKKENLLKNDVDFDISKISSTELENLPRNGVNFDMNNTSNTKLENLLGNNKNPNLTTNKNIELNNFKSHLEKNNILTAITGFSILKHSYELKNNNLLFAIRIFEGEIKEGSTIFCKDKNENIKESLIEELYLFGINEIKNVKSVSGSNLVLVKADLLKHSVISNTKKFKMSPLILPNLPFFKRKIILKDENKIDEFKACIKTLSFLETVLSVKMNCYDEFEIFCEGKVQLEKICNDLKNNFFDFEVTNIDDKFNETIKEPAEVFKEREGIKIHISIEKNENGGEIELEESGCKNEDLEFCREETKKILMKENYLAVAEDTKNFLESKQTNNDKIIEKKYEKRDSLEYLTLTEKNNNDQKIEIEDKRKDIKSILKKENNNKDQISKKEDKEKNSKFISINEKNNTDNIIERGVERKEFKSISVHKKNNQDNIIEKMRTDFKSISIDEKTNINETVENMKKDSKSISINEKTNVNGIIEKERIKKDSKSISINEKNDIYEKIVKENKREDSKSISTNEKNYEDETTKKKNREKTNILHYTKNTSMLIYNKCNYENIIKNVFEVFIESGPLVHEEISFTKIKVRIETKNDVDSDRLFSLLKESMQSCYNLCKPTIIPHYFYVKIKLFPEFLGQVYTLLHKYNFISKDEIYDEVMDFYIIECLIPQFIYYNFVDDIRMKTKGTVYLQVEEYGVDSTHSFDDLINSIKKKKGMLINEMIIDNPQKQRTLKK